MRPTVARSLLGLPPNASLSQIKAAYKKKALENHPDRLPADLKKHGEAEFRQITEAYTCLKADYQTGHGTKAGKRMHNAAAVPFLFIICGTLCLGGFQARRAYKKQQQATPFQNPFLP